MINIVPAIDIIEGRCVRLSQGDYRTKKVYDEDVVDMAMRYQDCGVKRIHIVDLDGAKVSNPCNLKTLEMVARKVSLEIEWGGGISSEEALSSVVNAGATQAIIGSIAVSKPEVFISWLQKMNGYRIILGADVRGRKIAVRGWQEDSSVDIDKIISDFIPHGLSTVICTDISRDGMLQGPSVELYESLLKSFPDIAFTASGGVSSMKDIEELDRVGMPSVIVGKAIYEHRISLDDIEKWSQRG